MERHTESYTEFRNVRFFNYNGKYTGSIALLILEIAFVYYLYMIPVVYYLINAPKILLIGGIVLVGLLFVFLYIRILIRRRKASTAYMKEEDGTIWKVRFRTLLRRVGSRTRIDTRTPAQNAGYYEVIATAVAEIKSGQRDIRRFNIENKVSKISDLEMVEEKKKYYVCRGGINGRKPREFKVYKCYDNIENILE